VERPSQLALRYSSTSHSSQWSLCVSPVCMQVLLREKSETVSRNWPWNGIRTKISMTQMKLKKSVVNSVMYH